MTTDRNVGATFVSSAPAQKRLDVTLTFDPNCSGPISASVTSAPAGLNCSTSYSTVSCSALFDVGTNVTLTKTLGNATTFTSFSGACTSEPCSLVMNDNQSVTATFYGLLQ